MSNNLKSDSFRMRGESMTRIEAFVAAAFAFAVTMLMISVGDLPENMDEFVEATKQIPAFSASCGLVIWIWHTHAVWCRRYGLEDGMTIFLSSSLIILVLTYIYPLRLIMQSLFLVLSNGYLSMDMAYTTVWEVRFMFAYYAIGFSLLSINFIALYLYAISQRQALGLNEAEYFDSQSEVYVWLACISVSSISLILSVWLPEAHIGFAGYALLLLFPVLGLFGFYRARARKKIVVMVN